MLNKNTITGSQAPSFINAHGNFLGHPKGLIILFLTEMWERFSYYGMRAILVLFLVSTVNGGFGWSESEALNLYGWYTMMVYFISIPGGIIADRLIGQNRAVMVGGFLLIAGHFLMAFPDLWSFYTALVLIVMGTGMLKPNISTMVGGLYPKGDPRRDAGFTIFYMGINLGALLAALIVGYVGETIGWHYGFSLAGFGMLLGQIIFLSGQKYIRGVGALIKKEDKIFTKNKTSNSTNNTVIKKIEKDRLVLLGISFMIVLVFWAAFEQAGGLMNLYTKNVTDRYIGKEIAVNEYVTSGTTAADSVAIYKAKEIVENKQIIEFDDVYGFFRNLVTPRSKSFDEINQALDQPWQTSIGLVNPAENIQKRQFTLTINEADSAVYNALLNDSAPVLMGDGRYKIVDRQNKQPGFLVPASWFQSLGSFFILIFGSVVAALWVFLAKRGKNPPSIFKMGLGTAIMGAGFIFMVFASLQREQSFLGLSSMWWLVLAYLFHTLGELCLSPVSLSYITKLAPPRMVASIMGIYFAIMGFGNKLAALLGQLAQNLGELQIFGGIATVSIFLGVILTLLSKRLDKLSHGAEEIAVDQDAQTSQILEKELL